MTETLDIRNQFDLPEDRAYLNTAYMGPLPRAAVEAGSTALVAESQPWTVSVDAFFQPVARLRGLLAGLLDGDEGGIALVPSVSYGIATAAANITISPGSSIVLLADRFPSNVYAWRELAARSDADVVVVPRSTEGWTSGLLAAIEDRTALVAIEACHWTDGSTVDLIRLGSAARAVGARLLVDVTQSLGAVPFPHTAVSPMWWSAHCTSG